MFIRMPSDERIDVLTKVRNSMPYADPEHARDYQREYRRTRRSGDSCTTPCTTRLPLEFRLRTVAEVLDLLEEQVDAVVKDADSTALEKARCVGFLASICLRAIEAGGPGRPNGSRGKRPESPKERRHKKMNTNGLAKHYDKLTPEERFRLIMAASSRGDETETDRLANAGQRIHFSRMDHAPFAHAFHDLMFLTYIELLEDAAFYQESNALTDKLLRESIEASRMRKRKKNTTQSETCRSRTIDGVEYPEWHFVGRTAYAMGFLLRVKMQGWTLFCARLNVAPLALWEKMDLPGLDRLKRALALAVAGAAFPSGAEMVVWVNEVRPAGDPEHTEADVLTAERFAENLDALFRERVRWWGG
jgi:hypothetical protein